MCRQIWDPEDTACYDSLLRVLGAKETWLFAGKILITFQEGDEAPAGSISWEGCGGFYVLSEAPSPLPPCGPIHDPCHPHNIREASGMDCCWQLGRAMIKCTKICDEFATREHVTLDWVRERMPSLVPKIYFQYEQDVYYYLIVSMPTTGDRLCNVWAKFGKKARHRSASGLARICRDLAQWQGSSMTGVDGKEFLGPMPEDWVDSGLFDFSPETLQRNAETVGMDCSTFVFHSIGIASPSSIFVDKKGNPIFIAEWECAGFMPRKWVLSSFFLTMHLAEFSHRDHRDKEQDDYDWVLEFGRQLKAVGFN
ncbi:hypothetical protein EDB81DRAFT_879409 [Dactylonectria macrodidyma]|uniref:Uncharacterized protein n=1 Tax=Dactylonectria macrodidyma TaxID=307937 RepID=A0A9P9FG55_9HYPO|nr:hypothetical protein EDB81DRAFT_879409 [Dactylonectria macrodidyma]